MKKMTGNNQGYRFYITPEEYAIAESNGIDMEGVNRRVRLWAWRVEKAITTPIRPQADRREWARIAKENGLSYRTFMNRIHRLGWEEERAALTPLLDRYEVIREIADKKGRKVPREYLALANQKGIPASLVFQRVRRGWSFEKAATLPPMDKITSGKIGAERSKNSPKQAEIQAWKNWLFPHRAKRVMDSR
ncbi:hypothetical protein [Brevibacillus sp. SIMBA_040]|uniref:hypothetical protein n=1 Tax=unclassified Brevibacillus TaxID=2684853 RepID=UPI003978B604